MGDFIDETIHCQCFSDEHQLRFIYFQDRNPSDAYNEVYVATFLAEKPWYKRVWYAVKYVFGYKCKYGHFQEFVVGPEQAERIKELMEMYLEDCIKVKTTNGSNTL